MPKTGGTSIPKALGVKTMAQHAHDPRIILWPPEDLEIVVYIREPTSWLRSWWTFINSGPSDGPEDCWWYTYNHDLHELARGNDFKGFVKSLPHGRLYDLFMNYTLGVDHVLKFGDLVTSFKDMTGRNLPHENKSDSDFDIDYETFEMIQIKEASTYERWFS